MKKDILSSLSHIPQIALHETRLLKNYYLKYDNSSISINVSENDVLNGNIIKVNL